MKNTKEKLLKLANEYVYQKSQALSARNEDTLEMILEGLFDKEVFKDVSYTNVSVHDSAKECEMMSFTLQNGTDINFLTGFKYLPGDYFIVDSFALGNMEYDFDIYSREGVEELEFTYLSKLSSVKKFISDFIFASGFLHAIEFSPKESVLKNYELISTLTDEKKKELDLYEVLMAFRNEEIEKLNLKSIRKNHNLNHLTLKNTHRFVSQIILKNQIFLTIGENKGSLFVETHTDNSSKTNPLTLEQIEEQLLRETNIIFKELNMNLHATDIRYDSFFDKRLASYAHGFVFTVKHPEMVFDITIASDFFFIHAPIPALRFLLPGKRFEDYCYEATDVFNGSIYIEPFFDNNDIQDGDIQDWGVFEEEFLEKVDNNSSYLSLFQLYFDKLSIIEDKKYNENYFKNHPEMKDIVREFKNTILNPTLLILNDNRSFHVLH